MGDLIDQNSINDWFLCGVGVLGRLRGRGTPAAFALNAFGNGVGQFQGAGLVADAQEIGLPPKALLNQPGDKRAVSVIDRGVPQRDNHTVSGLALGIAIGLQQLEALARGGFLAAEKHNQSRRGQGSIKFMSRE